MWTLIRAWWERRRAPKRSWRLIGYDTFADEYYELPGTYPTQAAAEAALREHEATLAADTATPAQLRDRVFVLRVGEPLPGPRFS